MAADRVTFVGILLPPEIKALPKILAALPAKQGPAIVKAVAEACLDAFAGKTPSEDQAKTIFSNFPITQDAANDVFAGVYSLLQHAYRAGETAGKQEVVKEDLDYLGVPAEFTPALLAAIFSPRRNTILTALEANRVRLPRLDKMQWRVDVSISTSSLKRAMRPSILTQLTLSNGDIETFEMSVDQFHQLRYNVAYVLKEMEEIEKKAQV